MPSSCRSLYQQALFKKMEGSDRVPPDQCQQQWHQRQALLGVSRGCAQYFFTSVLFVKSYLQGYRTLGKHAGKHAGNVITRVFCFESYLKIKENINSTASFFGRIGVGLRTKDRNPTSNPTSNPIVSYSETCLRGCWDTVWAGV